MTCCCETIHTLHVALVHALAEIQADLSNISPVLHPVNANAQELIEKYLTLAGLPVKNEVPVGLTNNVNLAYDTAFEFIPGSLEVFVDGRKLTPGVGKDYVENATFDGFDILINASASNRLNSPVMQSEELLVNYLRRVIFP